MSSIQLNFLGYIKILRRQLWQQISCYKIGKEKEWVGGFVITVVVIYSFMNRPSLILIMRLNISINLSEKVI